MREKISTLSIATYVSVKGFVHGLKKDERGLSGIVVAVMLILIAVLLIVMFWGSLSSWLAELWSRITGKDTELTGGSSF
ncbi:MAG: hypothetical protein FWH33_04175 [Oscillospiraceae bacterium]|nr:hypothetical protein [Oscillospiraceae bacterium]